jgi:hypothetical protein
MDVKYCPWCIIGFLQFFVGIVFLYLFYGSGYTPGGTTSLWFIILCIRKFNLVYNQLLTYHYLHGTQLGT